SLAVAATDNPSIVSPVNENNNIVFLPLNDIAAVEKEIDEHTCAVIVEGIQGVSGIQIPDPGFLQKIASLCRNKGALLILDEIQSGYGRTGKFFAHQYAGIIPDMITVAKGMGNGFPVGGVLISPTIEAKKEMLGTTFGGSYLACTAAIAVLEVIEKENLMDNALIMGAYLREKLNGLPHIKEIRGQGLMIGIELYETCAPIRQEMLYRHFMFTGSASNKNTIRILPSLAITKIEIDAFIDAFQAALTQKELA
ncbi:MAG: aminotransferase class III-fold pyridoxal phosphate-dependent enzyme, partial [Bacteroidota bacterium]|nr:aminotransferase class III-fold pyridoxal phosphate-dependent enzyme [Bacteroidota bacterium]